MISYLSFPQKSIRSELAKLFFSISIVLNQTVRVAFVKGANKPIDSVKKKQKTLICEEPA